MYNHPRANNWPRPVLFPLQQTDAEEAKKSLGEAIEMILKDRREEGMRGVPEDAIKEVVSLG